MKNKRKLKKIILTLITLLITIIVICAIAIGIIFKSITSKVEREEIDRTYVTSTEHTPVKEEENVINILLLGTDKYDSDTLTASDATMILTLDTVNKRIKLCSIMRDTYVEVPGQDPCNINDVIIKGGPELTLKTINTNFNLQIDKFVQVNLNSLPKIIDILGGVEINVTEEEVPYINSLVNSIDSNNGTSNPGITSAGLQTLNGTQASAYSRIRSTAGRDYKRTERQRDVLSSLYAKFKTASISQLTDLMNNILPLVSTNITDSEILSILGKVLTMGVSEIEQSRFPLDGQHEMILTDMYHMIIDKEQTTNEMHKFIFSLE